MVNCLLTASSPSFFTSTTLPPCARLQVKPLPASFKLPLVCSKAAQQPHRMLQYRLLQYCYNIGCYNICIYSICMQLCCNCLLPQNGHSRTGRGQHINWGAGRGVAVCCGLPRLLVWLYVLLFM
jgi:hypothetical protein